MPINPSELFKTYQELGTLQATGYRYGVTRERVRQILQGTYGKNYQKENREHRIERKIATLAKMKKVCVECSKEFMGHNQTCSKTCRGRLHARTLEKKQYYDGKKLCNKCGLRKPFTEFFASKRKTAIGHVIYNSICKSCRNVISIKWREKNPKKAAISQRKASAKWYQNTRKDPVKYAEYKSKANPRGIETYYRMKADPIRHKKYLEGRRLYYLRKKGEQNP